MNGLSSITRAAAAFLTRLSTSTITMQVHPLGISRRTLLLPAARGRRLRTAQGPALPRLLLRRQPARAAPSRSSISRRFRVRKQILLDAAPAAVLAHPRTAKVLRAGARDRHGLRDRRGFARRQPARPAGNTAAGMQLSPSRDALWVLYRDPAALVELPLDSFRAATARSPPGGPRRFRPQQRDRQAAVASRRRATAHR